MDAITTGKNNSKNKDTLTKQCYNSAVQQTYVSHTCNSKFSSSHIKLFLKIRLIFLDEGSQKVQTPNYKINKY